MTITKEQAVARIDKLLAQSNDLKKRMADILEQLNRLTGEASEVYMFAESETKDTASKN